MKSSSDSEHSNVLSISDRLSEIQVLTCHFIAYGNRCNTSVILAFGEAFDIEEIAKRSILDSYFDFGDLCRSLPHLTLN